MTSSVSRRSGITVVFVITGVSVCVVSTARQLAAAERLLALPRRRAKQLARARLLACGSVLSLVAACGFGVQNTEKESNFFLFDVSGHGKTGCCLEHPLDLVLVNFLSH